MSVENNMTNVSELTTKVVVDKDKEARVNLDHKVISDNIQDTIIVPSNGSVESLGDQDHDIDLSVDVDSEVDLDLAVDTAMEKSIAKDVSTTSVPLSRRVLSLHSSNLLSNAGTSGILKKKNQFVDFEFVLRGITEDTSDIPSTYKATHFCAIKNYDYYPLTGFDKYLESASASSDCLLSRGHGGRNYITQLSELFISQLYPYSMYTSMGIIENIQHMMTQSANGSLIYVIVSGEDVFFMTREEATLLYPEVFRDEVCYSKQDKSSREVIYQRLCGCVNGGGYYSRPYENELRNSR